MERAEFKRIDTYIEDIEENLEQHNLQNTITARNLTKLHLVIERLMHICKDTKDHQLKTSLHTLEHRARKCMRCIQAIQSGRN